MNRNVLDEALDVLLETDAYKLGHRYMYSEGTEVVFSNMTARGTRNPNITEGTVFFGLQAFLYRLNEKWQVFFDLSTSDLEEVLDGYAAFVGDLLGPNTVGVEQFRELHSVGHLPLRVRAFREGSIVPLRVPYFTIENTDPRFFWLTNYLETTMSAGLWHPITSATIAWSNRRLLDVRAIESSTIDAVDFQGHDFSYRGLENDYAAAASGAGHLVSFKGTDTLPAIRFVNRYYAGDNGLVGASVPACYDDRTEVLSENGFKLFSELVDGEKVAQYTASGTIEFVVPSEIFADRYRGDLIKFTSGVRNYINAVVTPNHKMVSVDTRTGDLRLREASEFTKWHQRIPKAGEAVGGDLQHLSDIDRMEIAFQADGSYASRAHRYDGSRSGGTTPIRFTIKKQRKKERLREILGRLGWEYTETAPVSREGYSHFWIKTPETLHKVFDWIPLTRITSEWAKEFIEEVSYWDGTRHKGSMQYSSTDPLNTKAVETVAVLAGYRTHATTYKDARSSRALTHMVSVTYRPDVSAEAIVTETVAYDGVVYCVSVPSKMIVVRREGRIMVSGNTEHAVMCSGIAVKGKGDNAAGELAVFERLLDQHPAGILSVVSDSFNLWDVCTQILPKLKDKITERDRTLVVRPDSGDPELILCGNPDAAEGTPERAGVVNLLAEVFGTTVNDKGYKELDSHIGVIYGDSINHERADAITANLMRQGYASTVPAFGFGSFSYQFQTRDTFKMAVKATWTQVNGQGYDILKDPITDDGGKKSATGRLAVRRMMDGRAYLIEHATPEQEADQVLELVYENGKVLRHQSFADVRDTLARESAVLGRRNKVELR